MSNIIRLDSARAHRASTPRIAEVPAGRTREAGSSSGQARAQRTGRSADSWIDEAEWQAGLPPTWSEWRSGFYPRF